MYNFHYKEFIDIDFLVFYPTENCIALESTCRMSIKRKVESGPSSSPTGELNAGDIEESSSSISNTASPSIDHSRGISRASTVAPAALTACLAALVKGPAASQAILTKHRASIDFALAKLLETVGDYELQVVLSSIFRTRPLFLSWPAIVSSFLQFHWKHLRVWNFFTA